MNLYKHLLAVLSASCLAFSGASYASVPDVDVGTVNVSGLPGEFVYPSLSLDINGFDFDSFTLDMVFDQTALSFLAGSSTVAFNGGTLALTSLPNYVATAAIDPDDGAWHVRISSFSLTSTPVIGSLVLNGAFKIANNAPVGSYDVAVSGLVSTGPVSGCEECSIVGAINVAVVPEPETWAFMLSGLSFLAWRRRVAGKG
jgi:hypothetical protein